METIPKSARLAKARAICTSGEGRRLRLAAGVSLEEVAADIRELTGESLSGNAVWQWEMCRRSPRGNAGAAYGEIISNLEAVLA
jgi:hypothetical protein